MKTESKKITTPVRPAEQIGAPEFGRTNDLKLLYGLRRGTVYNLAADGKIRGVVLRVRGTKSGVRLWDLQSVRTFIRGSMLQEGQ